MGVVLLASRSEPATRRLGWQLLRQVGTTLVLKRSSDSDAAFTAEAIVYSMCEKQRLKTEHMPHAYTYMPCGV